MKRIIAISLLALIAIAVNARVTEINDVWDIEYTGKPIVIEAYASWCGPCKIYGPIFESMASKYDGQVEFFRVNVEDPDSEDFVYDYKINVVPTTIFLYEPRGDGYSHKKEKGLLSESELNEYIRETISMHHYK